MATIVFFHAHPDDEAIFTGGTLARLRDDGHRTVVVVATSGEHGARRSPGEPLSRRREDETPAACEILGVDRVEFLRYADSGIRPSGEHHPESFGRTGVAGAAERLARILHDESADALVAYDEGGIYAHPDHVAIHRVGLAAARATGIDTFYEATVDREYLHFVETHLVGHAVAALHDAAPTGVPLERIPPIGVPTVMISATVELDEVVHRKRDAIAAHVSQVPVDAEPLTMDDSTFRAVYGYEWFVRHGRRGAIDHLSM